MKLLPLNSIDTSGYKVVDLETEENRSKKWIEMASLVDMATENPSVDLKIQTPAVLEHTFPDEKSHGAGIPAHQHYQQHCLASKITQFCR